MQMVLTACWGQLRWASKLRCRGRLGRGMSFGGVTARSSRITTQFAGGRNEGLGESSCAWCWDVVPCRAVVAWSPTVFVFV